MTYLENSYKINRFFIYIYIYIYNQNILKYKKYCIISDYQKKLLLIIKI